MNDAQESNRSSIGPDAHEGAESGSEAAKNGAQGHLGRWEPDEILKTRNSIARSLRDIETLAFDLHAQALASPNDKDFPGGTALHMLAPASSRQAWDDRYAEIEMKSYEDGRPLEGWNDPLAYQGNTEEQPLNVLATWTRMIREDREQPTSLTPTLSREVDYLRGQLDWACQVDPYGEPAWPLCFEMANELRTLVRRMEDVLHDGVRPVYGAPCLYCNQTLERDQSPILGVLDHYRCKSCGKNYQKANYDYAVGVSYLHHSPTLTAAQIEERTQGELTAGRVRVWGCRYADIKAGRNADGLLLYNVDAVLAKKAELDEEKASA